MKSFASRALPVLLGLMCLAPSRQPSPKGMDLERFAQLPVLHSGRIKPIDTVARASLLMIRGKQTLSDAGRASGALEWALGAMAQPESSDVQRIFRIDDPDLLGLMGKTQTAERYFSYMELEPSLNEIGSQAERAQKLDPKSRGRFESAVANLRERIILYQSLKNTLQVEGTRDWPAEISGYREAMPAAAKIMAAHVKGKPFDRKGLERINFYLERYRFLSSASDFKALAPPAGEGDERWSDLGESLMSEMNGRPAHPGVEAFSGMVGAYRRGDAASFDRALARYRVWIESAQPAAVKQAREEAWFNRLEPFYRGMILYLAAFLLLVASFSIWQARLRQAAVDLLWLAFIVHTAGLVFRIALQGRPPVTNLYSSAVFVGWGAVLLGLILERMHRNGFAAAVSAVTGFTTLIIAHHLANQGDTMEMMRAVLDSNFWLATHVVTITIGYSSMFLASALAHVYILRRWLGAASDPAAEKSLVSMTYGIICFSLFFSFIGTILGGIWADQSWGRFWGWDPKENGALLIVLWCAIVLHARWGGYARERGIMVMAVFGGIITSLSWFGVNMLGIGLHSYGFMEEAFNWLALFVGVELSVMALGAWAAAAPERAAKHA